MILLTLVQGQAQTIEPLVPELIRSVGAAGALLGLMFIMGWVVAGRTSEKWESRYDDVRAKLEAKDRYITEEIVPLLVRAVDVLGRATGPRGRDGG